MVNLIDCSKNEFISQVSSKKVYCFGAGKYLQHFIDSNYGIDVEAIIDNYRLSDESIVINSKAVNIISADEFARICGTDSAVIITCLSIEDILAQLDSMKECNGMDCYVELLVSGCTEHNELHIDNRPTQPVIPKKIHYCWFGGKDIPEEYQNYMSTWKKYCPDYEIIRWDESNYDIHKSRYVSEAYGQKKWAFVSDYARVDILYHEGGIYFDTDVELLDSFDEFLVWDLFCGFERGNRIAWGLGVGAVKRHPILKRLLEVYDNMAFVRENGSLNMKPCPVIQSEVMELFGFEMNGKFQARDHVAVFPQEFFGPVAPGNCYGRITGYSHSIHHYAASWLDTNEISKAQITRERIKKIKEHNRLRKFNANRSCHNLKNKIKKFQIWNCISDTNTAGSKAPADIRQISEYKGYQAIEIHSHSGCEGDWTYKRLTQEWDKCYELISNDSILLLQHPFWQEQRERNDTLLRLKEMKHVKVISLVHDVEELRGIFLSAYRRDEFKFMLQIADVLIVHNEKMKNYFINSGVKEERIVSLEIFDYLSDVKQKNPPEFEKSITIAGNLDAVKSRYLEKLNELAPLTVHLYGPNCTFVNADRMDASNIIYHGVVPSDALSRQLNCGFGLVWDGDSLDTCSGITGEYLKYNNPHKLSLYLSSGLPVIIWKEAAEAEFVLKNGVGIAVNSLYELREVIQNMNRKQYQQYVSSVEKIAFDIRKGKHTELAIERAESILKNVIM